MTITMFVLAVLCQLLAYFCARVGWDATAEAFRFAAIAYLVAWGATI